MAFRRPSLPRFQAFRSWRYGLENRFGPLWRIWLRPTLRKVADMLLAPLSLLTLQFLRGTGWYASKFFSAFLALAFLGALGWLGFDPQFYTAPPNLEVRIHSFYQVPGLEPHLTPDEVWNFQALMGQHILWHNPRSLREHIQTNPFVDGATVRIQFPAQVRVDVDEKSPWLLWVTNGGVFAVIEDGRARRLPHMQDTPDLRMEFLTLYDWMGRATFNRAAAHAATAQFLDPDLAATIFAIKQDYDLRTPALPPLNAFQFTESHGLHFTVPDAGTRVFWGDGLQVHQKLANLKGIETFLADHELDAALIDVRPIFRPYYR